MWADALGVYPPQWSRRFMFFFFQAEDGIRDYKVTGVQTCALPILRQPGDRGLGQAGAFRQVAVAQQFRAGPERTEYFDASFQGAVARGLSRLVMEDGGSPVRHAAADRKSVV